MSLYHFYWGAEPQRQTVESILFTLKTKWYLNRTVISFAWLDGEISLQNMKYSTGVFWGHSRLSWSVCHVICYCCQISTGWREEREDWPVLQSVCLYLIYLTEYCLPSLVLLNSPDAKSLQKGRCHDAQQNPQIISPCRDRSWSWRVSSQRKSPSCWDWSVA